MQVLKQEKSNLF